MKKYVLGAMLAVGLAATGARAADLPASVRQMLAMTPDDFARTASVKDDALEVLATITTEPGYQERHGCCGWCGATISCAPSSTRPVAR